MKPPIDDTRRQLGELGAMQAQVEQSERKILAGAEKRLAEVEKRLPELRAGALAHLDDAMQQYEALLLERGRLHQVIAHAREVLGAVD